MTAAADRGAAAVPDGEMTAVPDGHATVVPDGEMTTASERDGSGGAGRFGDPVELPWWVIPLGIPPFVTLALAAIIPAPVSGRVLDAVFSAGMLWVLVRVALRVRSSSMQSVWISAAYAFWLFIALLWAVEAHG